MPGSDTFGAFLKAKRKQREITVRAMAELVGISVSSYCDTESGRLYPPGMDVLSKMMDALMLNQEEREKFLDLAGKAREAAPPDLPGYINDNQLVRAALRIAKDRASDDDWLRFIHDLERKGRDG